MNTEEEKTTNFYCDGTKYCIAESLVLEAKSIIGAEPRDSLYQYSIISDLEKIKNKINETGHDEMKSFIDNCKGLIDNCDISGLVSKIEEVRNSLIKLDERFEDGYNKTLDDYGISSIEKFLDTEFKYNSDVDYCKLTDKQYNVFGQLSQNFQKIENLERYKGKYLYEIPDLVSEKNGIKFNPYVDAGLGDFILYDVIMDIYGNASVFVLKDEVGNYTLVFSATVNPEDQDNFIKKYEDSVYDVVTLLETNATNPYTKTALNTYMYIERSTVYSVTDKYYELAAATNKKINFYGFSKGGGMAELAYLKVAGKSNVGEIVLYNPLHSNLSLSQANILKESGDLTVYRNSGDLISTYIHEHTYDSETIFIDCNWASVYEDRNLAEKETGLKNFVDGFLTTFDVDSGMFHENIENAKYLFSGGAHSLSNYSSEAFDKYGNSIYNPDSYLYKGEGKGSYEGRSVMMYLYGIEDIFSVIPGNDDFRNLRRDAISISKDINVDPMVGVTVTKIN